MDNKKYKPLLRFNGFHEDWVVKKFSSVFSIFGNNTLSRVELNYDGGDVKNIHYGDVLIKYNECLNISEEEVPYINNAPVSNYNNIYDNPQYGLSKSQSFVVYSMLKISDVTDSGRQ